MSHTRFKHGLFYVKVDQYHFSDTFDTKYKAENYTHTDSDTNTNPYRHMAAIVDHLLLYKCTDKAF